MPNHFNLEIINIMDIKQSNLFTQVYKKLHKLELSIVNENIKLVIDNPNIGELTTGDLSEIRVHKFKIKSYLYLLAYEYTESIDLLYLMAIGEHENFYNKLKNHTK